MEELSNLSKRENNMAERHHKSRIGKLEKENL